MARKGFLVSLLPELRRVQGRRLSSRLREVVRQTIAALEHDQRMGAPSFAPAPAKEAPPQDARPPLYRVRILCVDRQGSPLPGARVRAFCRDYDLFHPFEGFATGDAKGVVEMTLPEGKWSFVGGAAPGAKPTLSLLTQVPIQGSKTVLLFPAESVSWSLQQRAHGFRAKQLVLRHQEYPQLSLTYEVKGRGGKIEAPRKGLEVWVKGETKDGSFVLGGGRGFRFDPSRLVPLRVKFGSASVTQVRVELRLRGRDPSPLFSFSVGKSGRALYLPGGSLDLGYRYRLQGVGAMNFGLRPYELKKGTTIWLGTPLRPWIWHLAYERRYRGAPPFAFQVFFRDPQDRLLGSFVPEKRGPRAGRIGVQIYKDGRLWRWVSQLRNFCRDLKAPLLPAALDGLEYELHTPFPIVGRKQGGHHSTRFHTKSYSLTGPALLAPEIQNFLRAAEVLLEPIRSVALRPLPWVMGRIAIHATMPRGVRAYSSVRGNSNFNSKDLARCVRLADALRRTPIMHEHLHTVGYKHSDFMDVAGFRLRKKLYPVGSRGQGGEVGRRGRAYERWFFTKDSKPHKKATLRTLLARFGGIAFDAYLQRRKDRGVLEARGLTEEEAKAVLFSRILGRDLFSWFGVAPKRSKDLGELIQAKASEAVPTAITGPGPRDLMARMDNLLAKKRTRPSLLAKNPAFQSLLRDLGRLPTQRLRIRTALRLGTRAVQSARLPLAYPCFRVALTVAQKMSSRIFTKTRAAAVDVCMGKPLHLGWL